MGSNKLPTDFELQQCIDADAVFQSAQTAAKHLGINPSTYRHRVYLAKNKGLVSKKAPPVIDKSTELRRLENELKQAQKESADSKKIKEIIGDIATKTANMKPPKWMEAKPAIPHSSGIPTLFLSDLHWGENVRPSQINYVNQYNLQIARERLKNCVDSAIDLLKIISPKMEYEGIVVALGGDMISGDIHEELAESNDLPTIPTVLDLLNSLASALGHLADIFGNVFVPCVTGNHGRNTKKIRSKDRHHTSFDWLLFQLLARHFENDKRLTFFIPDGSDASYRIHSTKYVLTHGDQFRGGDGMIGALGPIIRGDHRKRSRNGQIDLSYDVMICGHWHQYMHLTRLIVNGSLKGYDEYAYTNNFGFEQPQQALWLTHPKHGITFRMPVYVDRDRAAPKTAWVSIPK